MKEVADGGRMHEKNYELPDGRKIMISSERFRCAEILFNPSLGGKKDVKGIHTSLLDSIAKCSPEIYKELYGSIVLSGGCTLFEGIADRIWQEVHKKCLTNNRIKVYSPPERLYSPWLGSSMFVSLSTFSSMWINRQEYEENGGASIIHRKCF